MDNAFTLPGSMFLAIALISSLLLWTLEMWLIRLSQCNPTWAQFSSCKRADCDSGIWLLVTLLRLSLNIWVTICQRHRLDLGCCLRVWSPKVLPGKTLGSSVGSFCTQWLIIYPVYPRQIVTRLHRSQALVLFCQYEISQLEQLSKKVLSNSLT